MQLILASQSPRRKELLSEAGIPFTVVPSSYEEKGEGLSPEETVRLFSAGKAEEVYSRFPQAAVLGADTVVALDGEIFGKPRTEDGAKEMLRRLSGRTHSVFTGVCLMCGGVKKQAVCETCVTFYELSEEFIERYVQEARPMDKAGAYGIQDGYRLVKSYEGSYTNVVGLPMELVREYLKEAKIC